MIVFELDGFNVCSSLEMAKHGRHEFDLYVYFAQMRLSFLLASMSASVSVYPFQCFSNGSTITICPGRNRFLAFCSFKLDCCIAYFAQQSALHSCCRQRKNFFSGAFYSMKQKIISVFCIITKMIGHQLQAIFCQANNHLFIFFSHFFFVFCSTTARQVSTTVISGALFPLDFSKSLVHVASKFSL